MEIPLYLALADREFSACRELPKKTAWLSCHFSPENAGLSHLPTLPVSMVILDDANAFSQREPQRICDTLCRVVKETGAEKVLLDFQRPYDPVLGELAALLSKQLPCPVGVSPIYASSAACPVFVPASGITVSPEDCLSPWRGRETWLELTGLCSRFTISSNGCEEALVSWQDPASLPHRDKRLHCHYRLETSPGQASFYLQRLQEDLSSYLCAAAALGVTAAVGFYRELWHK